MYYVTRGSSHGGAGPPCSVFRLRLDIEHWTTYLAALLTSPNPLTC